MEFAGRSVVITGVGRAGQVGESVAEAFAVRGARVFLVDRHEDQAQARADALIATGGRAAALGADLTDPVAVQSVAERVRGATAGRVHAVVHLAGGFMASGPVAESDLAVWSSQFALHATSAYLVARAFLPMLRTTKGALVCFASEAVLPGGHSAGLSAYAAAKSAVAALVQAIAQEEHGHGVRANALAPTAIRTAANMAAMPAGTPMVAREAVSDIVLWLCSDAGRAITGQLLPVR
jgi:NAD(P)-dependent dehydrogenase (short-subunit alcohol dehydrogenase family)